MFSHSLCPHLVPGVQPTVSTISSPYPRSITITVKPASQYEQVNGEFQGYVVEYGAAGSQVSVQLGNDRATVKAYIRECAVAQTPNIHTCASYISRIQSNNGVLGYLRIFNLLFAASCYSICGLCTPLTFS